MFSEWSRELLQESGTGKHLIIPTSSSAMKFERKALNNPMKLPIKAMNTEVEAKLQSFFFFSFLKKRRLEFLHHYLFYKFRIYQYIASGLMEWKNENPLKR